MKYRYLFIIFLLIGQVIQASVTDTSAFIRKTYVSPTGEMLLYRVLYPENYDKSRTYPLILFLHGAGERGSDNVTQLRHPAEVLLKPENRKNYPAIVLLPQCPSDQYWPFPEHPDKDLRWDRISYPVNTPISKPLRLANELLDYYCQSEAVDRKRIYITGLSMGGMGTFDMVARFPKKFAAAVPICGGVNVSRLKKAKKVAFRIFHGDVDRVVPASASRTAYEELKRVGAKVEYIEYPNVDHDSWVKAFREPDFMEWLFKQKKN